MARPFPRAYKNPYMGGAMWNVEHSLGTVSLNIYKSMQNEWDAKFGREKNRLEIKKWNWRLRSINPKINTDLSILTCILAQILKSWLHGADKLTSSK